MYIGREKCKPNLIKPLKRTDVEKENCWSTCKFYQKINETNAKTFKDIYRVKGVRGSKSFFFHT